MPKAHQKIDETNVIFLETAHEALSGKAQKSSGSGVCSQSAYAPPKKSIEDGSKCTSKRNKQCLKDIKALSLTALKNAYPSEYNTHRNLKYRCKKGGGTLHPDFEKFVDFLPIVQTKPGPSFTLDRIDPDNPEYSPANTRWASKPLQTANRRNTVYLTDAVGNTYSVAEWSRRTGLKQSTIRQRLRYGWSHHRAVHAPSGSKSLNSSGSLRSGVKARSETEAQLKETKFIEAQMCRDPEYKEVWEALKVLREREHLPDYGVTLSEARAFEYEFGRHPENELEVYTDLRAPLELEEQDVRNAKDLYFKAKRAWVRGERDLS